MQLPANVVIKEVGPRDGLQNEVEIITTEQKIEWIDLLSETGLSYIEVTSFVNPKWIPQLSDAMQVLAAIQRNNDVTYAALVPNRRGLEGALLADVDEVSVFMSASETHNLKNINKSIEGTYPILKEVVTDALKAGKTARGYISTVFGCPYEGEIEVNDVLHVCEHLFEMGVREISLGDTIGVANPRQVEKVLQEILKRFDVSRLALHFHDTRGMALANTLVGLEMGFTAFDSSLGGLGGCPYAPGASGNVATDDLVHMLERMGIRTGINEEALQHSAGYLQGILNKPLPSKQMALHENFITKEGKK